MTLINCMKKIIDDRYLRYAISEGYRIVELEEKDKQSEMKIAIREVPAPFLAIQMTGHLSQLKSGKKGQDWNKICDYLLIYQEEDKHHAIFIELKESLNKDKKEFGKKQLRRSLPVLDYLCSVCKIESGVEEKILPVKYVLIAEKSSDRLDKQRIKVNPSETSEEEDDEIPVRILIGTEFALNTLMG